MKRIPIIEAFMLLVLWFVSLVIVIGALIFNRDSIDSEGE